MRPIKVRYLPQGEAHRHGLPDSDDYFYEGDDLVVVVTEQDDYRDTMLLVIHAVHEAILNEFLGVDPETVDKFDASIPEDVQAGDLPDCPYYLSHQSAMVAERSAGIVMQRTLWGK